MKNIDASREICSFLEKKVALFSRYLSLTERMNEALGEDDKDLKDLISKRQGCMEKIEKIDMSMQQAVGADPDKHNLIPPKFKGLISSYFQKLKSIMEKVELLFWFVLLHIFASHLVAYRKIEIDYSKFCSKY